MMKKLLLGAVAALSIAAIQPAHAQESGFNGFYAGVYGGYGWTSAENSNGADPDPSGTDYGIYGGYKIDSMLDRALGMGLTGAVEIHWGGSTADDTVGNVKMEKGREYGLSFRPGLTFLNNDSFNLNPYAILGYRNTEFEVSVPGLTADDVYHGFELGIGTELMAHENLGFRLDYSHVWYGEENGIDPSDNNIRFGVTYRF